VTSKRLEMIPLSRAVMGYIESIGITVLYGGENIRIAWRGKRRMVIHEAIRICRAIMVIMVAIPDPSLRNLSDVCAVDDDTKGTT
jgi:hypothetical protein